MMTHHRAAEKPADAPAVHAYSHDHVLGKFARALTPGEILRADFENFRQQPAKFSVIYSDMLFRLIFSFLNNF
jgi:hypothetical protein